MNADLEFRLRLLHQLNREEERFLEHLVINLSENALLSIPYDGDYGIRTHIEYIENGEDDTGYVTGDGEDFDLYLDKRMPVGMIIDYLIHELAHIASWHLDEEDDHGPGFGIAQASLYSDYLEMYDDFWGIK